MVKRVFAIIGIVLGSVAVFVGGVFGVMALMGKFKTPIVYPTVLQFEGETQLVLAGQDDPYCFVLKGENPNSEHEVNQKTCYIWFDQSTSTDLITLRDKDGNALVANESNRYKINCNEPVYYTINDNVDGKDGIVKIVARSEDEKVMPNNPLTLHIDREVKGVYVQRDNLDINETQLTQTIAVGLDQALEFDFVAKPSDYTRQPISVYPKKDVELYYASDVSDDFIKVTSETVAIAPLNEIMYEESGKFYFKSNDSSKRYTFKIAVFPTYESKNLYDANPETQYYNNTQRLAEMRVTTLTITVSNIDISKVDMLGNVALSLYAKNDYITLDGVSNVENAKDNNLEVYMTKDNTSTPDYERFNEVAIGAIGENVWSNRMPTFMIQGDEDSELTYTGKSGANYSLEDKEHNTTPVDNTVFTYTKVCLSANMKIIDYITVGEAKYYCSNGVAVMVDGEIKLLSSGSYMNFYIKDGDTFTIATAEEYDYIATHVTGSTGKDKTWNIVSTYIADDVKDKLYLGLLVVNAKGNVDIDTNFFATSAVSVNPVALNPTFNTDEETLNITYGNDGTANCDGKPFADFVTINANASYNACVFVVAESDAGQLETMDKTYDGYKLVGYLENESFQNVVKLTGDATTDGVKIYMLQLKNGYNQSLSDLIKNATSLTDIAGTFYEQNPITIKANYVLNPNLLTATYYDVGGTELGDNKNVYVGAGEYAIQLTFKEGITDCGMLDKIFGADGTTLDAAQIAKFLNVNYPSNLTIESVAKDNQTLTIKYEAQSTLNDTNVPIVITLNVGEEAFTFEDIYIKSSAPQYIVFKTGIEGDEDIVLYGSSEEALEGDAKSIEVAVSYDNGYVRTYKYGNLNTTDNIFNKNIGEGGVYFQDKQYKNVAHDISYASLNKDLVDFDDNGQFVVYKVGKPAVISVTIYGVTKYIALNITGDWAVATKGGETTFESSTDTITLKDNIVSSLKYGETELIGSMLLNESNHVYITDVRCITYGNGTLEKFEDQTVGDKTYDYVLGTVTTSGETETINPVVVIYQDEDNGWTIERVSNKYTALTIAFKVKTIAGEKDITLRYTNSITVSIGEAWKDRVLYAGTTAYVYEIRKNASTSNTQPILLIKTEKDITPEVTITKKDGSAIKANTFVNTKYTPSTDDLGKIVFTVKVDNQEIFSNDKFEVKPNVIATVNNTELTSGTTDNSLTSIYTFEQYPTIDVVYGYTDIDTNKEDEVVTIATYGNVTKAEIAGTPADISLSEDTGIITLSGSNIAVSDIKNLNETSKAVTVVLKANGVEINTATFTVNNSRTVGVKNNIDTLDVRTHYSISDILSDVAGLTLSSVTIADFDTSVESGTFIINTDITYENPNQSITFTFEGGYTYTASFTISPLTMADCLTATAQYAGTEFDLLGGMYDLTTVKAKYDGVVKSITVNGIYEQEMGGNPITSTICQNFSSANYDMSTGTCSVILNDIVGQSKTVYVAYTIEYIGGKTYTYRKPLTINNRQTITLDYPENDLTLSSATTFVFLADADGMALSGADTPSVNHRYIITPTADNKINYEPILVKQNSSYVMNFNTDDVKKIHRVSIQNKEDITLAGEYNTDSKKSTESSVRLIAYQYTAGMSEYIANINTTDDGVVTFGNVNYTSLYGYLIFKVTSVSGAVDYYYVYIYCEGDTYDSANIMSVIVDNDADNIYSTATGYQQVNTSEKDITTYFKLLESLKGADDKILGHTFDSKTKLYLYEGNSTVGAEVSNAEFELNKSFHTITIGLVYIDGYKVYPYGTMTLYLQPNNEITLNDTGLEYTAPNGEFTRTITARETTVPYAAFDATADKTSITYSGVEIATLDGTNISISQSVAEAVEFVVTYTISGTTIKVTYTLEATALPNSTETNPITTTVGEWDSTAGFQKEVTLTDMKFMEDYTRSYSVQWRKANSSDDYDTTDLNVKFDAGKLTFTQTHIEQTYFVKITYSDYVGGENTRIFKFIVLPEYHEEISSGNGGGTSSLSRLSTDSTGYYTTNEGSKIKITKTTTDNGEAAWTIGDLTIYTNTSTELSFTFDEEMYWTKTTSGNGIDWYSSSNSISETKYIGFAHLAGMSKEDTKPITMFITLTFAGNAYVTNRAIYLSIVPTYQTLQAKYLATDATHENVVKGDTTTLNKKWLNDRFDLIDFDGNKISSAKPAEMGFFTANNPNKLSITAESTLINLVDNGTSYGASFSDSVTGNVSQRIVLNNRANMPTVYYTYQIMTEADGIAYTYIDDNGATQSYADVYEIAGVDANGKVTSQYVSFLLDDTTASSSYTSDRLVIGTMKDTINTSVFSATTGWTAAGYDDYKTYADNKNGRIIESGYYQIKNGDEYVDEINGGKSTVVGGYTNGIQYVFTNLGYTLYITYDFDESTIEMIVRRDEAIANFNFSLSVTGNNNESFTAVTVYVYNGTLTSKYESEPLITYAGYEHGVSEAMTRAGAINGEVITYGLKTTGNASYYTYDGDTYYITSTDNALLEYDGEQFTLRSVSRAINATLVFVAKIDDIKIAELTYKLVVNRNMMFVVNHADQLKDTTSPTTQFVLTNEKDDGTIQLFKKDKDYDYITHDFVLDTNFTDSYKSGDKYRKLIYGLFSVANQDGSTSRAARALTTQGVDISFRSNTDPDYLELVTDTDGSISGIRFKRDFSGLIELELSMKVSIGVYTIVWNIEVTPIVEQYYYTSVSQPDPKFIRMEDEGNNYTSGAEIVIADIETGDSPIVATKSDVFTDYIYNKYDVKETDSDGNPKDVTKQDLGVIANYGYKVIKYRDDMASMTNEALYGLSGAEVVSVSTSLATTPSDSPTITIHLPSVPTTTTDENQLYYVTYEIYLTYLGLEKSTTEVFYVTYKVLTYRSVDPYEYTVTETTGDKTYYSNVVNADEGLSDTNLELFNYEEIFETEPTSTTTDKTTWSQDKYTIYYTSDGLKMTKVNRTADTEEDLTTTKATITNTEYVQDTTYTSDSKIKFINKTTTDDKNYYMFDAKAHTLTYCTVAYDEKTTTENTTDPTTGDTISTTKTTRTREIANPIITQTQVEVKDDAGNVTKPAEWISETYSVVQYITENKWTMKIDKKTADSEDGLSSATATDIYFDQTTYSESGKIKFTTTNTDDRYSGYYYIYDETTFKMYKYDSEDKLVEGGEVSFPADTQTKINATHTLVNRYENENDTIHIHSVFEHDFTNILDFKNFIEDEAKSVKFENATGLVGKDTYTISNIGNGRWGINLDQEGTSALFNNKLVCDLVIYDETAPIINIDFTMYGTKTISAKSSISLSTIFLREYTVAPNAADDTDKALYATAQALYDAGETVIGAGDLNKAWVESSDTTLAITATDGADVGKFIIGTKEYTLSEATFSAIGGTLYKLEYQTHYITESVIIPDYRSASIETNIFRVNFVEANSKGNQTLDLAKAVKKWSNNSDGILKATSAEIKVPPTIENNSNTGGKTVTLSTSAITMKSSDLIAYKNANPSAVNYPRFTVSCTADSVGLTFDVLFVLPDYPRVAEFTYDASATTDYTVDLDSITGDYQLYIPTASGYKMLVSDVTDEDTQVSLDNVTGVAEVGTSYLGSYDKDSGLITIDQTRVSEYFTTNVNKTTLNIRFRLTTEAGTVDFEVLIKRSTPTSGS